MKKPFLLLLVFSLVILASLFMFDSYVASRVKKASMEKDITGLEKTYLNVKYALTHLTEDPNSPSEVNASRGVFISYKDEVLRIKNEQSEILNLNLKSNEILFSCAPDNNTLPDGRKLSLYDTYVDISKITLDANTRLFPKELVLPLNLISGESIVDHPVRYFTYRDPSIVYSEIKAKIVFIGCDL